jgi:hypothetical protein
MNRDLEYRYATWDSLEDWLNCGWHFAGPASNWSAFVVWLCDCKPVIPAATAA